MSARIPITYEEAVRTLAEWQADGGPADLQVALFPDPQRQIVRFVEISKEFAEIPAVQPWTFGESREYPFKSSVALVSPKIWRRVIRGGIPLPEGWDLDSLQWVRPGDP